MYLKGILLAFEAVLGLEMNLVESNLYSLNADNYIAELSDLTGVQD